MVPVILRPSDWRTERLARLQALPTDAKPVTEWTDQDAAFLDVARGIRRVSVPAGRGRRRAASIVEVCLVELDAVTPASD